jgi:pantetheine-phosphate adenylyltransferase
MATSTSSQGPRALLTSWCWGLASHHGKQALIAAETRMSLLEKVTRPIAEHTGVKITVASFDGLAVDAARKHQAGLVIRGLRDSTDFDYEVQMGQMNGAMAPDIETVFLAASPATRMIASSLVKQIAKMGGDITLFIPEGGAGGGGGGAGESHSAITLTFCCCPVRNGTDNQWETT